MSLFRKHSIICVLLLLNHNAVTQAWTSSGTRNPQKTALSVAADIEPVSTGVSPLSYTLKELACEIGGKGRAQSCWDCFRLGVDPIWYFENNKPRESGLLNPDEGWTREQVQGAMLGRRVDDGLGKSALEKLRKRFDSIENNILRLTKITTCQDGTTKLLLQLLDDGLEVETVIIPWSDRGKSTLCISSQVGCRQACTFCMTGRMGKLRSLTSDEILAQMYFANKACRMYSIYPIDNIVFMGMGEPADNVDAVVQAAKTLVDPQLYQLAPRRVTISTVAPSPESFEQLGKSNVVLAWSVHASRDEIRQELVPTTRYSMEELRDGLIRTLQGRSKRLRNTMLEIALLNQINDSTEDAMHLVNFCQPIIDEVKGVKVVVNLIPWNDIGASFGPASTYKRPSMSRVLAFQKVLTDSGILCYVRTTRGDEENAACGMLATKKRL